MVPQIHPLAIAATRMIISAGILLAFLPFSKHRSIPAENWISIAFAGTFLALHFALWIWSLRFTSVADSLILVTMNPIIVAFGSTYLLKEKPSTQMMLGTGISILGCIVLILGSVSAQQVHAAAPLKGDIMALGGAVAMSMYMLSGRKIKDSVAFFPYITIVYCIAGVLLTAVCLISRIPLLPLTVRQFTLLALIALIPQVVGHSLINWSLRHLHASYPAAMILLEPLIGSGLAYLFLGEKVGLFSIVGGLLVIMGIVGVFFKKYEIEAV